MTTMHPLGSSSLVAQAYPRAAFIHPPFCLPKLHYLHSKTGLTVYRDGAPLAWIVCGFHQGMRDKQPHYCEFVDVAYHRKTHYGTNLETADFLTFAEALAFVNSVCGGES